MRGGEFEGERQAAEPSADGGDVSGGRVGERDRPAGGAGAIEEDLGGGGVGDGGGGRASGQRQGLERAVQLGPHP